MSSQRSWMGRLPAIASASTCAIFMAAGLLLIGAQRAVGNPSRVTEVLTNAFVRSGAITELLAPELMKGFGSDRVFASLTSDEMREIVRTIFPVEWQEAQAAQLAAQAYSYLLGSGSAETLTLSLEEPRQLMSGSAGVRVAQVIVRSWPACTADQIDRIDHAVAISPEMFGCEPPDPAASRVIKALGGELAALAAAAPAQVRLGDQTSTTAALSQVHAVLETLALWTALSILLSGAALLFALALSARSFKSVLRWTGISWMSGALLAIVLALVFLALRNRLPAGDSSAAPAVREAVAILARGVIGLAMAAGLGVSAVAFIVGGGVTALSFAVKSPAGRPPDSTMERHSEAMGRPGTGRRSKAEKSDIGGRETGPMPPSTPGSTDEQERPRGLFG